MNDYLKSAVKRDKRKKEFLISPISKFDAEVISELIVSLGKIRTNDDALSLQSILQQYKYLKDQAIADMLLGWNTDHQMVVPELDKDAPPRRKFIEFEGQMIEVRLILTVGIEDTYDFSSKKMKYYLVINKNLEEKYKLTNGYFAFESDRQRNYALIKLKEKLHPFIELI